MSSKTKVKSSKKETEPDDDEGNLDLSIIRKPISESISNFSRLQKLYNSGTAELREILTTECDYLYECKVCKNIFRSIIHLISHKRVYCKEKFNPSKHANFIKTMSLASELLKLRELDLLIAEMQTENVKYDKKEDEQIPMTKDLTEVIEKLTAQKGISNEKIKNDIQQVTLQSIPTSKFAVYQSTPEETYHMKVQVRELHNLLDKTEKIVLKEDGTINTPEEKKPQPPQLDAEGVIQISDEEEDEHRVMCKICKTRFSTQKTLRFHLKTKHNSSRLVYPCPDCTDLFSTSWSVYRHLFTIHKKTSAQVRKLREWVQSKTFRMDKVPSFYEKKKNVLKLAMQKADSLNNKPRNWVENIEGDGESPRCGGCGRVFERRAALAAHAYTCQPRRALMRAGGVGRPMQILKKKPAAIVDTTTAKEDSPGEDSTMDVEEEDSSSSASQNENTEVINEDNDTSPDYPETKPKRTTYESIEKRNMDALNKKILPDVELETLLCKKCNISTTKMEDLVEHMACHYNWQRYSCKLCFYRNFHIEMISKHISTVHKLNGDSMFYLRTINALEPADAVLEYSEKTHTSQDVSEVKPVPEVAKPTVTPVISAPEQTTRKRKLNEPMKKKKDKNDMKEQEISPDTISLRSEENSSDMEDIETSNVFVATKRPVRKRSKPKYDDFEYDLSNLLKMEAQGYKETLTIKASNIKKIKIQSRPPSPFPDGVNKDCTGALMKMSKEAVEYSKAHMKMIKLGDGISPVKQRLAVFPKPFCNLYSRDLTTKGNKISPSKDNAKISLLKESHIIRENKSRISLENTTKTTENTSTDNKLTTPETNRIAKTANNVPETVKPNIHIKMLKNPLMNKKLSAEILSKVVVLKQRMNIKSDTLKLVKIAAKPKSDSDNVIIKDIISDITENGSVIAVTRNKPEDSTDVNDLSALMSNNIETVTDT